MSDALPVPVSNARVRRTYDRLAPVYAATVGRIEAPSQRRALALLDPGPEADLLDVACGPGRALVDAARRVPDGTVRGVDAAPAMVARARDRCRRAGVAARAGAVVGDARSLPAADDAVDAVLALDSLELFGADELAAVLAEIRRVLVPGGRLCALSMASADVPDSRFLRAYEWAYRRLPGIATLGCRPVDLRGALRDAGLAVERIERERRAGVWPVVTVLARA